MHNVEFKAELRDADLARRVLMAFGARWIISLRQTDTYYRIPAGRLKKRECLGEPTEYIFYDRPDRVSAKLSHFSIYSEPQYLERFGTTPLPAWVTVRKTRDLLMIENVRVHLDDVEGLGKFLEFEALVSPDHNIARCRDTIARLRELISPSLGEPIACGYSDLLAGEHEFQGTGP
jgi:adenylate cyclase class IV